MQLNRTFRYLITNKHSEQAASVISGYHDYSKRESRRWRAKTVQEDVQDGGDLELSELDTCPTLNAARDIGMQCLSRQIKY